MKTYQTTVAEQMMTHVSVPARLHGSYFINEKNLYEYKVKEATKMRIQPLLMRRGGKERKERYRHKHGPRN